jgi:hypothetical protein
VSVGTKSDVYVQRGWPDQPEEFHSMLRQQTKDLYDEGYRYFRYNNVPEHRIVVIEGWKVRPEKEAPFELLLTAAPDGGGGFGGIDGGGSGN